MSVVAVKKYKNKIIISADSQTTWGGNKLPTNGSEWGRSKIFKSNDIIVGITGSVEESNFFKLYAETHLLTDDNEMAIIRYMSEFIKWIKEFNSGFVMPQNNYLIVIKNKVFQVLGIEVHEVQEYNAVGSGMFSALGAMACGCNTIKAVEIAKKYDLYCGGETVSITKEI